MRRGNIQFLTKKLKNLNKALGVWMKLGWSYITRPQQVGLKRSKGKGDVQLAEEIVISIKEKALPLDRRRKTNPLIRVRRYQLIVLLLISTTTDPVMLSKLHAVFRIKH